MLQNVRVIIAFALLGLTHGKESTWWQQSADFLDEVETPEEFGVTRFAASKQLG